MRVGRLYVTCCVVIAASLATVACSPAANIPEKTVVPAPTLKSDTDAGASTTSSTESVTVSEAEAVADTDVVSEGDGNEEITTEQDVRVEQEGDTEEETQPLEEPSDTAPGQSAPGASVEDSSGEPEILSDLSVSGNMLTYTDSDYGFSVSYPDDYLFRAESPEKLAALEPAPIVSYILMNPILASSDIAELEPADLEIRIHPADGVGSLDDWLASHGFTSGGFGPSQPFQTPYVTGQEICVSTMIAPGCFYFVLGDNWVYQMAPASLQGEAIMGTVTLAQ